ncbi:hypothetical protein HPP92_020730 [Vanilla planifolia]|uniref:Uncharacterized protein n=1 Tax=Vanilla planifolia TaxID=51239 RepID=A0A835Q390_VANPL|nr:hypothetical protein HPP92_021100 [Vanilla planifolia]KAG0462254.1 hypothetical protein HPP92_020730 [Vanilla planifolia]
MAQSEISRQIDRTLFTVSAPLCSDHFSAICTATPSSGIGPDYRSLPSAPVPTLNPPNSRRPRYRPRYRSGAIDAPKVVIRLSVFIGGNRSAWFAE